MQRRIFVTGLHRAGTHTIAKEVAKETGLLYIDENIIEWDGLHHIKSLMRKEIPENKRVNIKDKDVFIKGLKVGFVIQCPGLAHKTLELASYGKVYWVTRAHADIVCSMINASINDMAWHIVKGFKQEFPDDPIWKKLTYDGSDDFPVGFPKYYTLLIKVKEYFYQTRFKDFCTRVKIDDQLFYDFSKSVTAKRPLKDRAKKIHTEACKLYEGICLH